MNASFPVTGFDPMPDRTGKPAAGQAACGASRHSALARFGPALVLAFALLCLTSIGCRSPGLQPDTDGQRAEALRQSNAGLYEQERQDAMRERSMDEGALSHGASWPWRGQDYH
jgi:hypothetical protein